MPNVSNALTLIPAKKTSINLENVTQNLDKVFPNGNSIITLKVLDYTNRYNTFLNKTAESILCLTQTVYEAKANLDINEFNAFTKEVGLKSNATISKFIAIGEKYSRLLPYTNNLPCSWTTLYKLARMSQSDFDQVKDFLFAEMSITDVQSLLPSSPQKKKFNDKPDFKIYLELLNHNEKLEFACKLHKLAKNYKVHMLYPTTLSEKNCSH